MPLWLAWIAVALEHLPTAPPVPWTARSPDSAFFHRELYRQSRRRPLLCLHFQRLLRWPLHRQHPSQPPLPFRLALVARSRRPVVRQLAPVRRTDPRAAEPLGLFLSAAGPGCSSRIHLLVAGRCSDCFWDTRTSRSSAPQKRTELACWELRVRTFVPSLQASA